MPSIKRCRGTLFIFMALVIFPAFIGCSAFLSMPRFNEKGIGPWSLARIMQWSSERRSQLSRIKALAKISLVSEAERASFDAFLIMNNRGEGRIEAIGPWRAPIFFLVFNPDSIYFYPSNESRLYCGRNRPEDIQKLTGIPIDLSRIFDSLASNLPESFSQCSSTLSEEGYHHLRCKSLTDRGIDFQAKILIRDFPVIQEVIWKGDRVYENTRIQYQRVSEHDGYWFPEEINLDWQNGMACIIRLKSLKVNPPVSKGIFMPDATWFQGEVINIEDLDKQNG